MKLAKSTTFRPEKMLSLVIVNPSVLGVVAIVDTGSSR